MKNIHYIRVLANSIVDAIRAVDKVLIKKGINFEPLYIIKRDELIYPIKTGNITKSKSKIYSLFHDLNEEIEDDKSIDENKFNILEMEYNQWEFNKIGLTSFEHLKDDDKYNEKIKKYDKYFIVVEFD